MKLTLIAVVALSSIAGIVGLVACSSDDASPAPEKKDVQLACNDLCRASGYTNAVKDEQPTQTSCFCSVGAASAKVEATSCTKMCSDIGKSGGTPFGQNTGGNADSCKCE